MSNSTSHVLPYPIKGARFTLPIAFNTSAGTPTDPTTPDTEFSSDGGATFADCAEEITTGGTNGSGYLTLTGAETNVNLLLIAAKSANCVTTRVSLYPRVLASVGTGTLSAGSAGGGTLGTLLAYDVTGCFIQTTGGTGGGGTGGANNQARKIVTYSTTTGAFTVSPDWETTPDATTTYSVLLPEGVTLGMLRGIADLTKMNGSAAPVTALASQYDGTGLIGDAYPARQDQIALRRQMTKASGTTFETATDFYNGINIVGKAARVQATAGGTAYPTRIVSSAYVIGTDTTTVTVADSIPGAGGGAWYLWIEPRPSVNVDKNGFVGEGIDHSLNCCYLISASGAITTYAAAADTNADRGDALVAARTAASAGDTIRVYASADIPEQIAKNGVNWWFADGVTIAGQGDISIFAANGASFNVRGGAKFSAPGTASIIFGNDVGDIDLECESFYSESDLIDKDGGTVTIRCKRMESPTASIANWGMSLTIYCPQIVATVTHGTTLGTVGRTHIIGANIDSTAQAAPTVTADVAGVVLEDCRLVTKSTETNTFSGASATTVTLAGKTTYNKAVHANITLQYLPSATAPLTAAETRTALGMAAADLDTQLNMLSAGSGAGARTVTPTVNDGTVLGVLENALIRMTEGANSYTTTTNALGVASPPLSLDDATYDVVITKSGYTFTPTTLVVDGNETPTYSMTAITITPATDPAQTTGYVTTRDGHGAAKASVVIGFRLIKGPGDAGNSYDTAQFTATSNGSGLLEVTLLRDATYVGIRGDGREFEFVTGTASTHQLPENLGVDDA